MKEYISNSTAALIVLHEVYGINKFIDDVCTEYHKQGFDVFCPDMLHGKIFSYDKVLEAYDFFVSEIGFEYYKIISPLIDQLKYKYDRVYVFGFSVGATIAWKCCENANCDGIICCYGSRIRDYLMLRPICPRSCAFCAK